MSCIIIDALLTKRYKAQDDVYLVYGLSVVTVLLKDHGIFPQFAPNSGYVDGEERTPLSDDYARNFFDVIRVIERKAATKIFEYEFYKLYKRAITSHSDGEIPA